MVSLYTTHCEREEKEFHTYSISIISFSKVIHDYVGKLEKFLNSSAATSPWKDMALAEKDGY